MEPIVLSSNGLNNNECLVSIFVMGYKQLDKTKRCVECVLKYTKDINYELVLFDNCSEDGTLEFYKTVEFDNLKIIHSPKNGGAMFGSSVAIKHTQGKYIVILSNDVYVTENWLNNVLTCFESDERIGMVVPSSSNTSNLQDPGLNFNSFEEMHEIAKKHNVSNPLLWEERIRLIYPCLCLRREAVEATGLWDPKFVHDFSDDDYSIRMRRAGYKLILCGDTFVCHDHSYSNLSQEKYDRMQESLKNGKEYFINKFNLDPWGEVAYCDYELVSLLKKNLVINAENNILCIDVKCGESVLWLKNVLRKKGITKNNISIYNSEAKYFIDNLTITKNVVIDKMENLLLNYSKNSKDIVLLHKSINEYKEPIKVLNEAFMTLKPGGYLLFKLANSNSFENFLSGLGYKNFRNQEMLVNLEIDDVLNCLNLMPINKFEYTYSFPPKTMEIEPVLQDIFTKLGINDNDTKIKLLVKDYHMIIQKK